MAALRSARQLALTLALLVLAKLHRPLARLFLPQVPQVQLLPPLLLQRLRLGFAALALP
jgi:hypothetical protein